MKALEKILSEGKKSAQRGYNLTKTILVELNNEIQSVKNSLKKMEASISGHTADEREIKKNLSKQFKTVVEDLSNTRKLSNETIEKIYKDVEAFNITLFGRTMAGKSTLMEILTNGDGSSIGNGAQRKTTDVRSYPWKGLVVKDVPGIAAFNEKGRKDEKIALEAVRSSDCVLFLITDDSPQKEEAKFYAAIKNLGKPIIVICNVKSALNDEIDIEILLENKKDIFDYTRISEIIFQFENFISHFIPSNSINFQACHLLSRYLANKKEFSSLKHKLIDVSNFNNIEKEIINELIKKGSFYRFRKFTDYTTEAFYVLSNRFSQLLLESQILSRNIDEKVDSLEDWKRSFTEVAKSKINSVVKKEFEKLHSLIPAFVEENFENTNVGKAWKKNIKNTINYKEFEVVQDEICNMLKMRLDDLYDDLKRDTEFEYKHHQSDEFDFGSIDDFKKYWNWGFAISVTGLSIVGAFLASGPIGWSALGLTAVGAIGSFFFDSKEKKADKARKKLKNKIVNNVSENEKKVLNKLNDWLINELINSRLKKQITFLKKSSRIQTQLIQSYLALFQSLAQKICFMSLENYKEAIQHIELPEIILAIERVARIPGKGALIMLRTGFDIEFNHIKKLESILDEKIKTVANTSNIASLFAQTIGGSISISNIDVSANEKIIYLPYRLMTDKEMSDADLAAILTGFVIKNRN